MGQLVVVDDGNGFRIVARPTETDASLIVHGNTVLTRAIGEAATHVTQ